MHNLYTVPGSHATEFTYKNGKYFIRRFIDWNILDEQFHYSEVNILPTS